MTVIRENKKKTLEVVRQMKETYKEEGGEVSVTVYNGRKKIKGLPDFTMIFQVVNEILTREMKPATCKVLLYLLSVAQYDNFVGINIETLSEKLGMTKKTIITAMNELRDKNILLSIKDSLDKRRNVYRINPHHSWRGSNQKRVINIKAMEAQLAFNFDEYAEKTKKQMLLENDKHYENKGK
jgi:predicted transcriptional regulator